MAERTGNEPANGLSGRAIGGADRPPNPQMAGPPDPPMASPPNPPTVICKAMLFDLDGVLVDSTPAVARVWSAWALEHGMDPEDTVRRAHGRPSLATIRELLPDVDHEKENQVVEQREVDDTDGVIPLPGTIALLRTIPEDRWAIVTSCTRRLAIRRLEAAGLPIPRHFVTSNDITRGKPDPEPYLKGATTLALPAGDCVVVEDAPAGVRSGRAAGARVIGLRTTASDEWLREAGVTWIVDDLASIACAVTRDGLELTLSAAARS
jgi:sugar-phosphatase